jgi:hypothetical protein
MLVKDARDRYLAANGFSLDGYTSSWFSVKVLGIPLRLPNTPGRQRAVPLHDLHHVATGYDTTWVGEGEIAAWELGAGCTSVATYFLNGNAALIGLFLAPRRVIRAFRRGRQGTSLYRTNVPYERLEAMTVEELQRTIRPDAADLR